MKGRLIIISSPSGGGKGTLIKEVLESVPQLGYSISYTTRLPRSGEEEGRHYHFVTKQQFEEEIAAGSFLEYAEVHGNLYGTSLAHVNQMTDEGHDVVLEIDVQGADWVRKRVPDVLGIFIMPPSFAVLKARLIARGTEKHDDLELRLTNARAEVLEYSKFDYVIINDEIFSAARKLAAVIIGERQHRNRQTEAICDILDSFDVSKHHLPGE
ncbi:MAG TPA: guanylate kinase [Pyrinomonadaceae bacterium]|jgi:guanylate kinase